MVKPELFNVRFNEKWNLMAKGVGRELGEAWQMCLFRFLSVSLTWKDAPFLWVSGEGALAQEGLWLTSGEGQRVLACAVSQIPSA